LIQNSVRDGRCQNHVAIESINIYSKCLNINNSTPGGPRTEKQNWRRHYSMDVENVCGTERSWSGNTSAHAHDKGERLGNSVELKLSLSFDRKKYLISI